MTSYLAYSTVALNWNRKIQCGNSCRGILSSSWLLNMKRLMMLK